MTGGAGYAMDAVTLTETAATVRAVSQTQHGNPLAGLAGDSVAYGDDEVHAAFAQFCSRWSDGVDVLTRDAATIADTLDSAVSTYRAAEEVNGTLFAPGNGGFLG